METAELAQILGLIFTVMGLGVLCHRAHIEKAIQDMVKHPASQLIFGLVPLILGSVVIVLHNDWREGWSLLVTLVGWLLFFGALFRIWLVDRWVKMMSSCASCAALYGGVIVTLLGVLLLYVGFGIE